MQLVLTPELLIEAYKQGLFPMAHSAGSPYLHWICPEKRGQLSITDLHIPNSLEKVLKNKKNRNVSFQIKINTDFEGVIRGCAASTQDRPETWINDEILKTYCELHRRGGAHSVEYWEGEALMGGVYGVSIGGAFFGESMFSRTSNASKIALVHLCARLWKAGYSVLDTQFVNDHLKQFGAYEIAHTDYKKILDKAVKQQSDFMLSGLSEQSLIHQYLTMHAEA
jgi:leucyl/phenylalanyl-tRNA--protein transferase